MTPRPPLDELLALFRSTVAAEGVTTGAGAGAGNSIIDAGLAGAGANSFVSMLMVVYPGQPRLVDSMDITGFNNATGEVTLSTAYKGVAAAIPAGVPYKIVTFRFVPAEVAAIQADIGDASASTLGSLYAILGNPAQTFLAMIGYEGATALASKLTAARAALLDQITALRMAELDAANIPADIDTLLVRLPAVLSALRIGYLDNINQAGLLQVTAARAALLDQITALRMAELDAANLPADVDTLLARLSAARAGYLDNLLGVVSVAGSPFSLVNNILEQDAIIVAAGTQLVDIEMDMNTLTQTNTIREYVQVDGANYRQISAKVFPTDFDTGTKAVVISFAQKGQLYKITMQASVLEGVARAIPFRILYRDLA